MNQHFIIKLITGEMIYGKVNTDQSDNKVVIVKDPLMWEEYYNEDGAVGSTLIKYCTGTHEREVPFTNSSIISMNKMSKPFENFYDAAVEIQLLYESAYDNKLKQMTNRMRNTLLSHMAFIKQKETDELVGWIPYDSEDNTLH